VVELIVIVYITCDNKGRTIQDKLFLILSVQQKGALPKSHEAAHHFNHFTQDGYPFHIMGWR